MHRLIRSLRWTASIYTWPTKTSHLQNTTSSEQSCSQICRLDCEQFPSAIHASVGPFLLPCTGAVLASQQQVFVARGHCYSHNSLSSSALTQRPVLPPSIMSRKLQFPHVSCRELWSALIEYSWYFPCFPYWASSPRQKKKNLEGWGATITSEGGPGTPESLCFCSTIWCAC